MQLPAHLRRLRDRVGSLRSNSAVPEVHRPQSPVPDKKRARKEKKVKRASSVPARGDDDFRCRGYRATRTFDDYGPRVVDITVSDGYQNATVHHPRGRKLSVPEIISQFPQPPRRPIHSSRAAPPSNADYFRPTLPIRRSPDLMKPVPGLPPLVPNRRPVEGEATLRADLEFAEWHERVIRKEQDEVFRAVLPALAQRKSSSTHSNGSTASLHTNCGRTPPKKSKKGPPVASSASHSVQLQSASPASPSVEARSRKLSNSSVCSERTRLALTAPWKLFAPKKKVPTS
ncbi:hypothetical protein CPB83DRAFT_899463 [Crepidotus variabilis]|uniref:Uncharacterized protein n=1 Tax=Crepidotus variabilis TaxID=179855 RepID=A0A9P6E4Y9_9AGAR|nr:hypothetical protein CPB83DRAFT_899463 [Crepidotus variabilis]